MTAFICETCGVQYAPSAEPLDHCLICEDDRQYVGWEGQTWTTFQALQQDHENKFESISDCITSIWTEPKFGIGQRAFLIQTNQGNILWDCISLLDEKTIEKVQSLGGIDSIAVSHPHYYSCMVEWAETFDAKVYLHEADAQWITRPSERIKLWTGETYALADHVTLVNTGGHFDGFQVLHFQTRDEGILFAGDQPQVCMDRKWVSFLYSYPNMIPFSASEVRSIGARLAKVNYSKLYGAFVGKQILEDAQGAVKRSLDRYLQALQR